jgi:hypothetical protein
VGEIDLTFCKEVESKGFDNERVLEPGTAVILHPTLFTPDGKNSFFW